MKKHVLSIDDQPQIGRIIERALTLDGCRVSTATQADAALRVIESDPPDLVILDLQLEDTDGFLLVDEIRRRIPAVPVLLLTGVILDPAVVREALGGKVSSYLAKPSSLDAIRGEVRRLLGGAGPREQ